MSAPIELLHFSPFPLATVYDTKQGGAAARGDKPNGLWVSVGPEWAEWCIAEDFATGSLRTVTRVVLAEDASLLWLASPEALDDFTKLYGVAEGEPHYRRYWSIDWSRVAQQYDGIVIAPYQWERRFSLSWYYGWDVASGCIWNSRAVASLESVSLAFADDAALPSETAQEGR